MVPKSIRILALPDLSDDNSMHTLHAYSHICSTPRPYIQPRSYHKSIGGPQMHMICNEQKTWPYTRGDATILRLRLVIVHQGLIIVADFCNERTRDPWCRSSTSHVVVLIVEQKSCDVISGCPDEHNLRRSNVHGTRREHTRLLLILLGGRGLSGS